MAEINPNDITEYIRLYTDLYDILESIHEESARNNEVLTQISESIDGLREEIKTGPQTELHDGTEPEDEIESEESQITVIELLEGIDETLTTISETGESISNTVSGNSVFPEETDNSAAQLLEAYTEAESRHEQNETYVLSLCIGILFITALIAGLKLAHTVFGKMR